MGINENESNKTHVVKRVRFSRLGPTHRCDTCGWEGTLDEASEHEGKRVSDLGLQLALIVENAIEKAFALQAGPQGIGDIEIYGCALDAAESIIEKYGNTAEDKQYAICKWNPQYAEPSRGSYIGAWVPV